MLEENSMKALAVFVALAAIAPAWAQTPSILLEACNAMEPASKRLECLRAASGVRNSEAAAGVNRTTATLQPLYTPSKPLPAAAVTPGGSNTVGSRTCYVGPRGGTYTITASGRKNYSGC
jgi:hypothetical protein